MSSTPGTERSQKPKIKSYFAKEKLLLKLFGISLKGGESIAYKVYSFFIIFPFNFMYPVLMFKEVFNHDFEVVASMITYAFSTTISLCKTLVLLRNRIIIGKLLDKLEEEPFATNLERGGLREEQLLKDCIWITNIQTQIYWMLSFFSVLVTASYSLINRIISNDYHDWELPYSPLTVLNTTHSPNFEITWFYESFSIISVVVHFTTADLLMAAVLAHISNQFKMLQNNLRRIISNTFIEMQKDRELIEQQLPCKITNVPNSNVDGSVIPWKYLQDSLRRVVHYHLAILDIATELEDVFNGLLLLVFLGTLAVLCFLIYHTTRTSLVGSIRYVVEMITVCLQVATVSYWGEQVVFESQEVGKAAFEANFVGSDVKFQRGLVMVIRRSQNPTRLSAGKFADICLSTFVWVLRTSYSSFMVLRNTNKI